MKYDQERDMWRSVSYLKIIKYRSLVTSIMLHLDATYNVDMRYNSVDIQNILYRRLDLHVHLTCMFIDKQYICQHATTYFC